MNWTEEYRREIEPPARIASRWWACHIAAASRAPAETLEPLLFEGIIDEWLSRRLKRGGDWPEDVKPILISSEQVTNGEGKVVGGFGTFLTELWERSRVKRFHLVPPRGRAEMAIRYNHVVLTHCDEHYVLFVRKP
jgi:hypothetical protein